MNDDLPPVLHYQWRVCSGIRAPRLAPGLINTSATSRSPPVQVAPIRPLVRRRVERDVNIIPPKSPPSKYRKFVTDADDDDETSTKPSPNVPGSPVQTSVSQRTPAEVEDSRARRKELNKRNSRKQRKKDKDRLSQMSQQLEQLQQENGTLRKIHGLDDGHTSLPSTRGAAYHCQQLGSILELVHFDWLLLSICQGAPVTLWPELAQTMQVKGPQCQQLAQALRRAAPQCNGLLKAMDAVRRSAQQALSAATSLQTARTTTASNSQVTQ
ncbi:hypothetical protein PBRA_008288 [Plasmodiophora brassicae]|uniref:BZIP domain-containing protein n=1 Tax=Plasmodiophora brassicae TaxID=37360 RepID=A0A0G4J0Y4_PLABS|nr:hypothetical protein PBRA_008288 [Plasmodiophora brassicae]